MKLNIANPFTGAQKMLDIEDESKLRSLYDKRLTAEVDGNALGEEFKGYIFKITGGNDKQGFGMKHGVLVPGRVRLLMTPGDSCFRGYGRRNGERCRKSVRGCIVSPDIAALNLVIVKQGRNPIPGLTDRELPRLRVPKRASKIRKLFQLSNYENVLAYSKTLGREIPRKNDPQKKRNKTVKVQRLVTSLTLQRKRARFATKRNRLERSRDQAIEFHEILKQHIKEQRLRKSESVAKKKAAIKASQVSKYI